MGRRNRRRGVLESEIRSPICFSPQAARTFVPIFLMKTKLVLAGKSKAEIVEATTSALAAYAGERNYRAGVLKRIDIKDVTSTSDPHWIRTERRSSDSSRHQLPVPSPV
jgi:hypothetical protein